MLSMLQSVLLVFALSLDAFVASIAYGVNKIKIPALSMVIINTVCTGLLAFSMILGTMAKSIMPGKWGAMLSFITLMALGVFYLCEGFVKGFLAKTPHARKQMDFKVSDLKIVLSIYIDETRADMDDSHHLSPMEAVYLAAALSLDSLAVGFGSGLGELNCLLVIILSWILGIFAISGGLFLGRRLAERSKVNLSWVSGILLMILALLKLV